MSYTIDPVHSHVGFSVRHMMVTTVRGQFTKYSGTVNIDASDFSKSTFAGDIDVASIDTGNPDRDKHLRSPDFFDSEKHSKISFTSTSIAKKGDEEYSVTGDITIRGITKPITLAVEYAGTQKHPSGKIVAGLTARGELSRKDFGMEFNAALDTGGVIVSDKVKLELDLQAVQG